MIESYDNKYVLGFAFTIGWQCLLTSKLRPDWQAGQLNGIGGKIEERESAEAAMHRECNEETGLSLPWRSVGRMRGKNVNGSSFVCHIFTFRGKEVMLFRQIEDEVIDLFTYKRMMQKPHLKNLEYLIPFCMSGDAGIIDIEYR
jgi:8-oxo-dGTP diphosphatase